MFGTINTILTKIDDLVWGVPLIVMILATGIFLTIRLKGIQVRKLILAFKYMFSNETDGEHGEISSFHPYLFLCNKMVRRQYVHRLQPFCI